MPQFIIQKLNIVSLNTVTNQENNWKIKSTKVTTRIIQSVVLQRIPCTPQMI